GAPPPAAGAPLAEVALPAARHLGMHEVRERFDPLLERCARIREARVERGDFLFAPATLRGVGLALLGRELALAGLPVLVAEPVRLVELGLERRRRALRGDRSVDVERDAALAGAFGDLVAALVETARVEHGRGREAR